MNFNKLLGIILIGAFAIVIVVFVVVPVSLFMVNLF